MALSLSLAVGGLAASACGDDRPSTPRDAGLRPLRRVPAPPPATPTATGGFRVLHTLPRGPQSERQRLIGYLNDEVLAEAAADLNAYYRLPRDVSVRMVPCGTANAAYVPADHVILFCEEFVDEFVTLFAGTADADDRDQQVVAATAFFFLHEVGHALIGELELPVFGNEEAAADTYAAYLLLSRGHARLALGAADTLLLMARQHAAAGISIPAWDVHGLDEQRFFNVVCLIYGSDPARFARIVDAGFLPVDKARECPDSWRTSAARIELALAPATAAPAVAP